MIKRQSKIRRLDLNPLAAVVLTMVFATSAFAVKYIPGDTSVGTWDPVNRIYTLNTDVYETIQIDEDNLTLNGAGYTVTGTGVIYTSGVYLKDRTGVTIKNLTVDGYYWGIHLLNSNGNTLTDNTVNSSDGSGIYVVNSSDNTLTGNTASNNDTGIQLVGADNNTLTNNNTSNNVYGIKLFNSSDNNILTNNTANSNNFTGIRLYDSSSNTLTGNTTNWNNSNGIQIELSSGNTVTGNTASDNTQGIKLTNSSNYNTLTGNTAERNTYDGIRLTSSSNYNTLTNNTTSDNLTGIDLNVSSNNSLTHNTAYSNYVGIHLHNSSSNTVTGNTANSNSATGIILASSSNDNTVTNNTANSNHSGIYLVVNSNNNSVTGNTASLNDWTGIYLENSSNNILTGNTASDSGYYGIRLVDGCSDNQVYNNNFIDNGMQAYVEGGSGNLFNLPAPIGGNYWSDWTSPDDDGDGFVDNPYIFTGGQDNLPWAVDYHVWLIEQLVAQVMDLNLNQGIENSLDAKLNAVVRALDDLNQNNDVAAINTLQAFINAVEAQRGNKIPEADADTLIAETQYIIDLLMAD